MGFSEETSAAAREIIARYPPDRSRSALLPLLHLVQSEQGYISPEGVAFCAGTLGLTKAEVGAVATFYTMYKRRPTGDWLVSVCTNTMCGVLGANQVYQALSEYLGVGHDETTADGTITLEHAECLAACDYAPVMTVNYEFFDKVDADTALGLVKQLQDGQRPHPTRGPRLCTLKEMSLQLAGFADDRAGAMAEGPPGDPTLAGNRLAERYGIAVAGFDPNTPIPTQADREAAAVAQAEPKAAVANAEPKAAVAQAEPKATAKEASK
jgi:NADH-quinone oxidoreductase subunit E